MAVLLGSFASLLLGVSDLCIDRTLGQARVAVIIAGASLGALLATFVGLVFISSDFLVSDVGLGALAGVLGACALAAYFAGLHRSAVGVVGPLTAVQVALWPLGYDVISGARPSTLIWVGVIVALVSLILTTLSPDLGDRVGIGVRLGLLAGACFGLSVTIVGATSATAGVWPAIAHRGAGTVVFVAVSMTIGERLWIGAVPQSLVLVGGALGGVALICFLYGAQHYSFAVVAVTGALFPAVSAALLYRFGDHPLRWWQGIGIIGAITGTAIIAVG